MEYFIATLFSFIPNGDMKYMIREALRSSVLSWGTCIGFLIDLFIVSFFMALLAEIYVQLFMMEMGGNITKSFLVIVFFIFVYIKVKQFFRDGVFVFWHESIIQVMLFCRSFGMISSIYDTVFPFRTLTGCYVYIILSNEGDNNFDHKDANRVILRKGSKANKGILPYAYFFNDERATCYVKTIGKPTKRIFYSDDEYKKIGDEIFGFRSRYNYFPE